MRISDRTAAIVSGTALVIHGALRRGPWGAVSLGLGGVIAYFGFRNSPEAAPVSRQVLRASHTVEAEPYDAFVQWRDLSLLPTIFSGLRDVKRLDNGNWRISFPGVGQCEASVVREQPGHVIEWRSVEGAPVESRGLIRFTRKKNGRGTKVHHEISYGSPGQKSSPAPEPALQKA